MKTWDVFLCFSLFHCLKTRSLTEPKACFFGWEWLAMSSQDLPASRPTNLGVTGTFSPAQLRCRWWDVLSPEPGIVVIRETLSSNWREQMQGPTTKYLVELKESCGRGGDQEAPVVWPLHMCYGCVAAWSWCGIPNSRNTDCLQLFWLPLGSFSCYWVASSSLNVLVCAWFYCNVLHAWLMSLEGMLFEGSWKG